MKKVVPTTKEQLIYFMLSNLSLGTYDKRFLSNVESIYLTKSKPLTSNQVSLFDKIITRYSKQLLKKEITTQYALSLGWSTPPIQSSPEYTSAKISIENDEIILRSPYKADFVKEFKTIPFVKWNRETKIWTAPLCEHTLKQVVSTTTSHYSTVNYCDVVDKLLQEVDKYKDILYWTPTLKYINNQLLIMSINKSLYEAIKDTDITLTLPSISKLVRYGITIDDSVKRELDKLYDFDKVEFACSRVHKLELQENKVLDYITSINVDCVFINEWFGVEKSFIANLQPMLESNNIKMFIGNKVNTMEEYEEEYKNAYMPVTLATWSGSLSLMTTNCDKIIHLVNSKPIKLK